MLKYEFINDEEKKNLISQQLETGLFLIEEQYLKNGNFLVFSETLPENEIVYMNVPQEDFESIQTDLSEVAETTAVVLEDTTTIAQTTASLVEDNTATAETLAQALLEIENLKSEITTLKGA